LVSGSRSAIFLPAALPPPLLLLLPQAASSIMPAVASAANFHHRIKTGTSLKHRSSSRALATGYVHYLM
jgi:hypothetical protein